MFYWQDLKYALRLLARSPLFTLLTVVVLAGGLGLSIFTFSFLHTAMLKSLPVPGGESIVRLLPTSEGVSTGTLDAADLAFMRPSITTLTDIGAYSGRELLIGSGESSRAINATETEWSIFRFTHTSPALGRGFRPEDAAVGAEPVIVLSQATWRAVFGGDTTVLGTQVRLSGMLTRVIGIMPEGYGFPVASEAWIPLRPEILTAMVPDREFVDGYARLAPGVDAAQATSELTGLLRRAQAAHPITGPSRPLSSGLTVSSFPLAQIGDDAPLVLGILNTVALLILLLACVNVTNLLLARANERARETAVRLALGAPRARLIVQSMWESIVLCILGGTLATGLATWGLGVINGWARAHLEGNLAFWWVWGFDRTVLLAAGGFVTVAIAILGGVASRRAVNTEIHAVLQEGGARGGGRREGRVARALVIGQVSVVSLLLFIGSMSAVVAYRVVNVDFGYETRNLLSASVEPPEERYPDSDARGRFYQSVYDQLVLRPELDGVVERTSLASVADVEGEFELGDRPAEVLRPRTNVQAVLGPLSPLGVTLREGRFFDTRDDAGAQKVALVSQAMAQKYWPNRSPLGSQLRLTGIGEITESRTVVGVVGDVLLGNPFSRDRSAIAAYIPLRQSATRDVTVAFRHRGSEAAARAAFHETIAALDPQLVPSNVRSFQDILAKSTLMAKSVTSLFAGCFAFALLLAVSGTYGLMTRSIGRRTREIGVRRALGATDGNILAMLLSDGGRQLGIGALIALPLSLTAGWGLSRYFPIAFSVSVTAALLVSAAITLIVLAATWIPTRRAIAIEPRDALWRD